jgi:hypothetical protein
MNPTDVHTLLGYASSLDPRIRRKDDDDRQMQAAAWYAQLHNVDPADARTAVDLHYSRQGVDALLPADVAVHVKAIRRKRIDTGPAFDPQAYGIDPDDFRAYKAAEVDHTRRIASGEPPRPAAAIERLRPVGGLIAGATRSTRLPRMTAVGGAEEAS